MKVSMRISENRTKICWQSPETFSLTACLHWAKTLVNIAIGIFVDFVGSQCVLKLRESTNFLYAESLQHQIRDIIYLIFMLSDIKTKHV